MSEIERIKALKESSGLGWADFRMALQKELKAKKNKLAAQKRKLRGYPEAVESPGTVCDCCGGPPTGRGGLHLDHCHKTGKFRGWLCSRCNMGIGLLGDDLDGIKRAKTYLLRTANGKTI